MIESVAEILELFGDGTAEYSYTPEDDEGCRIVAKYRPVIPKLDRYIIDSCVNLAKRNIVFEAATELEYLNARRSFYIYKIDEFPKIPIINIYELHSQFTGEYKVTYLSNSGKIIAEEEAGLLSRQNLEKATFQVDFVNSLTDPATSWSSITVKNYKALESVIEEAYARVLKLETV